MLDDEVVIRLLDHGAVRSADGRRLGRVGQLFRSDSDGESTWVSVDAGSDGDGLQALVPMAGSRIEGDDLHVAHPADAVAGAPRVAVGEPVSAEDEQRVRVHYQPGESPGSTDPVGDGPSMVRSEERLSITTEWVPVRRARLEKFQVTETRTIEVPWTREDVRVVYEALDGSAAPVSASAPLTAAPQPWVLMEERIVVTTEWVPTESVRLVVDRVDGQQQVTESVRKEQVALDPVEPAGSRATDAGSPAGD